jgi:fimbrial chaperone protein
MYPVMGAAADFSVNPVRVFFNGGSTNSIEVENRSDETLTVQVNTYSWEHDITGKDIYSPTKDIIYFPKLVKIPKDQKKVIRLATTTPRGEKERTYRMYVQEIPAPAKEKPEKMTISLAMRMGIPIFVPPLKEETHGSIDKLVLEKGQLYTEVKNKGNIHFIIRSIKVTGIDSSGNDAFKTEMAGGYVHGGNSKGFNITIPQERCQNIRTLNVDIETDKLAMANKINVDNGMCIR